MGRRLGLVPAALALLLLLLPSTALAAPNNGTAAIAKAAAEKEALPTPEDPRDADGKIRSFFLPSWPTTVGTAIGVGAFSAHL